MTSQNSIATYAYTPVVLLFCVKALPAYKSMIKAIALKIAYHRALACNINFVITLRMYIAVSVE